MPGFLALLTAKMAGLGAAAKGALAAVIAALTMTAAGGAAGVIPLPGSHADAGSATAAAVHEVVSTVSSANSTLPATTAAGTGMQAEARASASSSTSTTVAVLPTSVPRTSTAAATGAGIASRAASAASAGAANLPGVSVPTIPGLAALPRCVADLLPTGRAVPDPVKLATQLPACILSLVSAHLPLDVIQGALASANLPVDLTKCLSSVIRAVPGFAGGNVSGLAQLVSSCMPAGSLPGRGSIPGTGSIPNFGFGFGG